MESMHEPVVVAVMGATGAGKSSLIRMLAETDSPAVGHGMMSETESIISYTTRYLGYDIVLVDTPGFDDSERSDANVLELLCQWLVDQYWSGFQLSGILYLHRITDNRMGGSAARNLRIFRELCGDEWLVNIVLCCTFWQAASIEQTAAFAKRFSELTQPGGFWHDMHAMGAMVEKSIRDREHGMQLIYDMSSRPRVVMHIQREVIDKGMPIASTSAVASLLQMQIDAESARHDEEVLEHQRRYDEDRREQERLHLADLQRQQQAYEEQLRRAEHHNQELRDQIDVMPLTSDNLVRPDTIVGPSKSQTEMRQSASTVNGRQARFTRFTEELRAARTSLGQGLQARMVKCVIKHRSTWYLKICVNCMHNIGAGPMHKCVPCSQSWDLQEDFVFCNNCFEDDAVRCNDRAHSKSDMLEASMAYDDSSCPKLFSPIESKSLVCSKCRQSLGQLYLHCCDCSEGFNMCLQCSLRGGHCRGHGRKWPHPKHYLQECHRFSKVCL